MKKLILSVATTACSMGLGVTSCNTPAQNEKNAENKTSYDNKDLDKANEEYMTEIENYKKATAEKVAAYEKNIVEFKERIDMQKKEARDDYRKKIIKLEEKNSDLKMKVDNYKADGKVKWELFKSEFSRDMEELSKAYNDLIIENVK